MNKVILFISILLFGIVNSNPLFGQKKSELLKKQEKILLEKIEHTKVLIDQTRATKKLTLSEINIVNRQIKYRQKLIDNYNFQLRKMDEKIQEINRQVNSLVNTNKILREEYKKMLLYAFKNRDPNYKFLYIISASTFSEAFHRMKYIQHYKDYRLKQIERIKKTQNNLAIKKEELNKEIIKKKDLLEIKKKEKLNYQSDKNSQLISLDKIRDNEQNLAAELEKNNKKRNEIVKAVKKAIEDEIKALEKLKKAKFALTPEGIAMSKSFNKNKGRLIWPVERGEITSKYGRHQHHLVTTAFVDNNGVDITTSKNANVRAVFEGKVTSVLIIPGAGRVVMVSHGEYRTVYANLQEVYVKKGDQVKAKDKLGKLLAKESGISESHFEIWRILASGMSTVNPSFWLSK
jgi:septal ring factor EnvC (AmiA/AmiB activator)